MPQFEDEDQQSFALAFLDAAIAAGRGPVTFANTEDGDVGVWLWDEREDAPSRGHGDTAEGALTQAAKSGRFPGIVAAAEEAVTEGAWPGGVPSVGGSE